jgi:hypothetical protein
MEPPPVRNGKRAMTRARLTNNERREINEYGLVIPSRNSKNYAPKINNSALLWSSGLLPGSKPFNYRNKAKKNLKNTWEGYLQQRANAEAKAKANANTRKKNKNKANNNNGTRRALF